MALTKGEKANLKTIIRAAKNGDLALIEGIEVATGERRAILCAISFDGREYVVSPFGALATDNPYEQFAIPEQM